VHVGVLGERNAVHQLHGDERRHRGVARVSGVDLRDAGVVQPPEQVGFEFEPAPCRRRVEVVAQHLQGDGTGGMPLFGQVDDAGGAAADDATHGEAADLRAWHEGRIARDRRAVDGRRVEKVFRDARDVEQALHFTPQGRVVATHRAECRLALRRAESGELEVQRCRPIGRVGGHR
jgi:hypothetical protein